MKHLKEGDKVLFDVWYGGRKITESGIFSNGHIVGNDFEDKLNINDKIILNLRNIK